MFTAPMIKITTVIIITRNTPFCVRVEVIRFSEFLHRFKGFSLSVAMVAHIVIISVVLLFLFSLSLIMEQNENKIIIPEENEITNADLTKDL